MIRTNYRHSISSVNNHTGLETDVMRFFAIIALCLMVIFSLVQSLPLTPAVDQSPTLISNDLLKNKINALEEQIANLKQKNANLSSKNKNLQSKVVSGTMENVYLLEQISEIQNSLQRSEINLAESQSQISKLENDKQSLGQQLSITNKKIQVANKKYERALKATHQAQKLLQKLSKNQKTSKSHIEEKATSEYAPIVPDEKPIPKSKGFSLTFSDDKALLHLIREAKISFYLIAGKEVFKFKQTGSFWDLSAEPIKEEMYIMHQNTVPNKLKNVAKHKVVTPSGNVEYGVILPATIRKKIGLYMQKYQSGNITIDQHARTEIKNAED